MTEADELVNNSPPEGTGLISHGEVHNFPGGSCITFGEMATPEGGRAPYIALSAPGQYSSLTLWIDPVSFQPMMTCGKPGQQRTVPLDKRNPFEAGAGSRADSEAKASIPLRNT